MTWRPEASAHVAVLRDPSRPTPVLADADAESDADPDADARPIVDADGRRRPRGGARTTSAAGADAVVCPRRRRHRARPPLSRRFPGDGRGRRPSTRPRSRSSPRPPRRIGGRPRRGRRRRGRRASPAGDATVLSAPDGDDGALRRDSSGRSPQALDAGTSTPRRRSPGATRAVGLGAARSPTDRRQAAGEESSGTRRSGPSFRTSFTRRLTGKRSSSTPSLGHEQAEELGGVRVGRVEPAIPRIGVETTGIRSWSSAIGLVGRARDDRERPADPPRSPGRARTTTGRPGPGRRRRRAGSRTADGSCPRGATRRRHRPGRGSAPPEGVRGTSDSSRRSRPGR